MGRSCRARLLAVTSLKCFHTPGHCCFRLDCWPEAGCWHFYSDWVRPLGWACCNPADWWSPDCSRCCSWSKVFEGNRVTSANDPLSRTKFPYRFQGRTSRDDATVVLLSRDRWATELLPTEAAQVLLSIAQLPARNRNIRRGICRFPDSLNCDVAGTLAQWFQECLLSKHNCNEINFKQSIRCAPAFSNFECFCFCPSADFEFFAVDSTMSAFNTARLWLILARLLFSINGLLALFGSPLSIFIVWLDVGANFMIPPPDDGKRRRREAWKNFLRCVWRTKNASTANATFLRGLKSFTEFKFVRLARVLFCSHVPRISLSSASSVECLLVAEKSK